MFAILGVFLPLAQAAPATGQFTTEGSLQLPEATNAHLDGIATLLDDTSGLDTFFLKADRIKVCNYSLSALRATTATGDRYHTTYDPKSACFFLDQATLSLIEGDQSGWLGMRTDPTGEWTFQAKERLSLMARSTSRLADETSKTASTNSPDTPEQHFFVQDIDTPHLFSTAKGALTYTGKGELKIKGADFQIVSTTNTTTYRTGETWDSGAVAGGAISWVVIQFTNAYLGITSPDAPFELAASQAEASTEGIIEFQAAKGTLDVDGTTYTASEGRPVRLEGQFETRLAPAATSRGILLALSGDMHSLNVDGARFTPTQDVPSSFPWLALLLVGMVALGAGGLLVHYRPRIASPFEAEQYWTHADYYIQHGDYERALMWTRKAREASPRLAWLAGDEARCLQALGDVPGALKVLEEAHRLAKHGDHALTAARLLREHAYPLEAMEDRLVAALQKSPKLLDEIEEEFPEILMRPGWATVAKVARLRIQ